MCYKHYDHVPAVVPVVAVAAVVTVAVLVAVLVDAIPAELHESTALYASVAGATSIMIISQQ
jgi:hypothetical protein